MTFLDLLKLARRWWWIVVLGPLVAALAAYLISSTMTPLYRATATLVVRQSQSPATQNLQELQAAQQESLTYSRLITTRPVLTETIARLGLPFTPDQLAEKVSASPVRDTQLLDVSATDPNPKQAAAIANTVSTIFIEQNQKQQESLTGAYQSQLDQNLASVKQQIDDTSAQIARLQGDDSGDARSQVTALQQQLAQDQSTYGSLLQARQQMAVSVAQLGGQVRVAEQAAAPSHYVSPRTPLNVRLGGVLGLMLAGGLVLLLGYLDDTVKTSEDVESVSGRPALGAIPHAKLLDPCEAVRNPRSAASESYRALRTNLQFATSSHDTRSLAVTSFRPGDGKTTTICNLAIALAEGGQRVILVDADLRKPRVHRLFETVSGRDGLTNLLLSKQGIGVDSMLQPSGIENLAILASGPMPPNPPDTLSSARMRQVVEQLEAAADIVLFDTTPMVVSDPLILAGLVDGVLLVTFAGRARTKELAFALQRLGPTGTPVLGVVLNHINPKDEDYYYYDRAYYDEGSGSRLEERECAVGMDRRRPPSQARAAALLRRLRIAG